MLDLDKKRGADPIVGRKADEAMMAVCDYIKANRKTLSPSAVDRTVATIKGMKLRPYWNYCREHLTDIGLEF